MTSFLLLAATSFTSGQASGIGVGILCIVALLFFGGAWSYGSRWRLVSGTPTSRIGSCPDGFVELKGRVVALDPLESPYSEQPCVYYSCTVERYVSRGKHGSWRTAWSAKDHAPFLVDDGSGVALIKANKAEMDLRLDTHGQTGLFDGPTAKEAAFFERCGIRTETWLGLNEKLRITERFLAPSDEVYILGCARPGDGAYRARIVVQGPGKGVFFISDQPEESVASSALAWAVLMGLLGLASLGGIVALLMQ